MTERRELSEPIGVWLALWRLKEYRIDELPWLTVVSAAVLGGAGGAFAISVTSSVERADLVVGAVPLAIGLLAVVFAALAIVVALPASRYLDLLGDTPDGGMRRFLEPFLVVAGVQVTLVLGGIAYRLFSTEVASWIEHVAFAAVGFFFVLGLLEIVGLARQLVKHGVYRAADAADEARRRHDVAEHVGASGDPELEARVSTLQH